VDDSIDQLNPYTLQYGTIYCLLQQRDHSRDWVTGRTTASELLTSLRAGAIYGGAQSFSTAHMCHYAFRESEHCFCDYLGGYDDMTTLSYDHRP
jgi:hypothetical protein